MTRGGRVISPPSWDYTHISITEILQIVFDVSFSDKTTVVAVISSQTAGNNS